MPLTLHWHTEPFLLLAILFPGWLYALAVGPWRGVFGPGQAFPKAEAARFFAGLAVVYLAVGSPLDSIGESFLFTAHMLQHMLLIYVAPPLLITGLPAWLTDGLLARSPAALKLCRTLVHPAFGGTAFVLCFSVWHFPELYVWALNDKSAHILEHWIMFLPACLMVWPVVSKSRLLPRLSNGGLMFYGFILMVGDLPLWAALIFGEDCLYRTYEYAPRICYLDPMQDQIAGAIVMKLFNEGFSLLTMGCAFFRWSKEESHGAPEPELGEEAAEGSRNDR